MRETFTSGSVGRAPGNRCLYPEPDRLQPPLLRRSRFRQQVSFSVRPITEEDVAIKIVILGAGALGSIIGGHLVRAGEEVTLIARGQRAAYLQQHGLTLTGLADFTVPVAVTTQPQTVGEADILVVAVKTYDTEPALASVSHLQVGSVLSIQNGVLKDEQVAHTFGWDKTLGAATFLSGEVTPAGPVRFLVNAALALGEVPAGISTRVQTLVTALIQAGIRAEAVQQIQTVEWSKYALFLSWMAPAVLTRLESCKFHRNPDTAVVVAQLVRETGLLAAQLGIALEDREPLPVKTLCSVPLPEAVATIRHFGTVREARAPAHKHAALQDLERGQRLEVEETLGYAIRKGAALGIPLPTIDTCYRLIAGINQSLQ
jgi:2-dehydropantoate 2-reductase